MDNRTNKMDTKLGTLKNVNLREAWSNEAQDFTPWLANNLDRLSTAIGIPLELGAKKLVLIYSQQISLPGIPKTIREFLLKTN